MNFKKIICIGDLNADLLVPYGEAKRLRQEAEKGKAVRPAQVVLQSGGTMGNVCSVLGRLGDHPYFVTDLCADAIGRFLRQDLEAQGVDFSFSVCGDNQTIVCIAVLENGERLILPWLPPQAELPRFRAKQFTKVPREDVLLVSSGMILTNDEETMRAVVGFIEEMKRMTASRFLFDLNLRAETYGLNAARREAYTRLIACSDVLLGSGIEEFGPLTEETDLRRAAERLADGKCAVIARNGKEATFVVQGGQVTIVEPETVKVVSTLGAGDTFDAAFVHAYRKGESIVSAVRYATHVAGYMISHAGHLCLPEDESVPTKDESVSTADFC